MIDETEKEEISIFSLKDESCYGKILLERREKKKKSFSMPARYMAHETPSVHSRRILAQISARRSSSLASSFLSPCRLVMYFISAAVEGPQTISPVSGNLHKRTPETCSCTTHFHRLSLLPLAPSKTTSLLLHKSSPQLDFFFRDRCTSFENYLFPRNYLLNEGREEKIVKDERRFTGYSRGT